MEKGLPANKDDIVYPIVEGRDALMRLRSSTRRNKLLAIGFFSCIAVTFLLFSSLKPFFCSTHMGSTPLYTPLTTSKSFVPLEAHIMSKCPDAKVCLKELVLPAMQRVYSKVNFTLSYIGTPTDNDGVDCMHGPGECMGNIIELCAATLYPDPKIYLGFTMCLTRDYQDIPERNLVEDCALEHGIDFQMLNDCSSDEDGTGIGMLRDSVRRSIDAGVTTSCTVRLNNEIYCIRDGGKWKDCKNGPGVNDLVIAVEKLYNSGF